MTGGRTSPCSYGRSTGGRTVESRSTGESIFRDFYFQSHVGGGWRRIATSFRERVEIQLVLWEFDFDRSRDHCRTIRIVGVLPFSVPVSIFVLLVLFPFLTIFVLGFVLFLVLVFVLLFLFLGFGTPVLFFFGKC